MSAYTVLKRTPVRRKRSTARIDRLIDRAFIGWIHGQPCLIEGKAGHECKGRITAHHVREYGNTRSDRRTLALCQAAHMHDFGPDSIERLGKQKWQEKFGVDIQNAIRDYNAAYVAEVLSVPASTNPNELRYEYEAGQTRKKMIAEELYG